MDPTVAGLVLAGGQSRRMGCDKALLTLPAAARPVTLLAHTCAVAQRCTSHTYVLTTWPERYARLLPTDITLLTETKAGAGPMSALLEGWSLILNDTQLRQRRSPDWLLLLACDMPALDAATLQQWSQNLVANETAAIAALPQQANRWEPLCGFYHRRCLPSLRSALSQNISSFQRWLKNESVIRLPVANFNVLRNCNTPAQWQHFLESTEGTNP